jgi:hypothetical protein
MMSTTKAKSKMDRPTGNLEVLPPEIRMRIYGHLLGRCIFHISHDDRWPLTKAKMCLSTDPHASVASPEGRNPSVGRDTHAHKNYYHAHHACREPKRPRQRWAALELLFTCRKIYREACLIPFQENTFSFSFRSSLGKFALQTLKPHQRRALRSLQLLGYGPASPWLGDLSPQLKEDLAGIVRLELWFEMSPSHVFSLYHAETDDPRSDPAFSRRTVFLGVKRSLRAAGLKNVTAFITDPLTDDRELGAWMRVPLAQFYTVTTLREWEKEVEETVLKALTTPAPLEGEMEDLLEKANGSLSRLSL